MHAQNFIFHIPGLPETDLAVDAIDLFNLKSVVYTHKLTAKATHLP